MCCCGLGLCLSQVLPHMLKLVPTFASDILVLNTG
jgi:hypothetical protein